MALTLTVEDGSNVTGANSYVTIAEATTYFEGHQYAPAGWADLSTAQHTTVLVHAARLLNSLIRWNGARLHNYGQAMDWPRMAVLSRDGSYYLDPNAIPQFLKDAQCELVRSLLVENLEGREDSQEVTKAKLDALEVTFAAGTRTKAIPSAVQAMIDGYGEYVGTGQSQPRVRPV